MTKGLSHIFGSHIGNTLQSQANMHWISWSEIIFDALIDQIDEVAVLADEHWDEQITNLFFCVFVWRQQIDSFHVPKVNVVAKEEYKKKFANILFLLVSI